MHCTPDKKANGSHPQSELLSQGAPPCTRHMQGIVANGRITKPQKYTKKPNMGAKKRKTQPSGCRRTGGKGIHSVPFIT